MPASKEALGIIDWLTQAGVPFVVTSKFPATPGVHAANSYHYAEGTDGDSLAVDFDGDLRRIHNAFVPIRSKLAELLGPDQPHGTGPHVHVAVPKGMFLVPWPKEAVMAVTIVTAFPYEGGYVIVLSDGSVYCFGCTYRGRVFIDGDRVTAEVV